MTTASMRRLLFFRDQYLQNLNDINLAHLLTYSMNNNIYYQLDHYTFFNSDITQALFVLTENYSTSN